ncbi:hypothetical protein [Streptomyces sp. JH14]|uniref:hypothetical protein n=1 Tax=Streptomyces sp. JH14 TaxID=2793630 RepID=UPI003211D18F
MTSGIVSRTRTFLPQWQTLAKRPSAQAPYVRARAELKLRLLGPSDPPSAVRFSEAARSLCAAADDHRARMEQRLLSLIPTQRGAEEEKAGAAVAGESSTSLHQA